MWHMVQPMMVHTRKPQRRREPQTRTGPAPETDDPEVEVVVKAWFAKNIRLHGT